MAFPEWVERHKGKGLEIKTNGGHYYLYERKTVWDAEKKQPRKISGTYLGRITEDGLIPPKHKMVSAVSPKKISNREYGATRYLRSLGQDIAENLAKHFPDSWREIFVMATLRAVDPQPFKRIESAYGHSFLSEDYAGLNLCSQSISRLLRDTGERRHSMVDFMKGYILGAEHILFDGTRITSYSQMDIAQVGYNSKRSYDPQVNLIYAFSTQPEIMPVYYRAVAGSICDVTAFRNCAIESGMKEAIVIADKGFGSEKNFEYLQDANLKYVVPLRRSCREFDEQALRKGYADGFEDCFLFNNRPIWYFDHAPTAENPSRYVTYIDSDLRTNEEADYLRRIQANLDGYTKESFKEKRLKFGTLILRTNLEKTPMELYETYKSRASIEQSFDILKNLLNQDTSYMQSDVAFEAWAFINHISLMLSYRLYNRLQKAKLLKKYSLRDVLFHLSFVHKIFINDQWILSEIPKKSRDVAAALDFELDSST